MTPLVVAEMTVEFDVAMPTCDAPGPLALKKTRSPAWTLARLTAAPWPNWAKEVRGSETPDFWNAHTTRPEQSKPAVVVPPYAYGVPIAERAAETAEPPPPDEDGACSVEPEIPIAAIVAGPTIPSAVRPLRAWNALTAERVIGPYAPSALRPSFFWTAIVTHRP